MTTENLNQYATLKNKKSLSIEEQAVFDAIIALATAEENVLTNVNPQPKAFVEAADVLEDAQEALVKTPSTTV